MDPLANWRMRIWAAWLVNALPEGSTEVSTCLLTDYSSCGGRLAAGMTVALRVRDAGRREIRRRILEAQLSRLLRRVDAGPSAVDAADRAARLIASLEHDDLDW
jgi:hypothetical protein